MMGGKCGKGKKQKVEGGRAGNCWWGKVSNGEGTAPTLQDFGGRKEQTRFRRRVVLKELGKELGAREGAAKADRLPGKVGQTARLRCGSSVMGRLDEAEIRTYQRESMSWQEAGGSRLLR